MQGFYAPSVESDALRAAGRLLKRFADDADGPIACWPVDGSAPFEHAALIEQEHGKWTRLVEMIGFKPE